MPLGFKPFMDPLSLCAAEYQTRRLCTTFCSRNGNRLSAERGGGACGCRVEGTGSGGRLPSREALATELHTSPAEQAGAPHSCVPGHHPQAPNPSKPAPALSTPSGLRDTRWHPLPVCLLSISCLARDQPEERRGRGRS